MGPASPVNSSVISQLRKMAAKSQEQSVQSKKSEKILPEENQSRKLSRSVSLSRINHDSPIPDQQGQPSSSKRKAPDHPSPSTKTLPKGKVSVKETKAKFELQEKYRNQRNMKDLQKEKNEFKGKTCKMTTVEVVEDPIAKLIKEMHANIKEIKSDQKSNNNKIDDLSAKVLHLENKSNDTDLKNQNAIEEIKGQMSAIEESVTSKLLSEIEPSLNGMREEIQKSVGLDLRRLVKEEMALQKMWEAKNGAAESYEEFDPEDSAPSEEEGEVEGKGEPAKKSKNQ